MKKTIVCISILLLALFFAKTSYGANPIDALQPDEWYEVPNSKIRDVLPNPLPPGNGPDKIITGWNGGAYDTKRDHFIVWGGGHNDYAGNEIYTFDITTLSWSRAWGPTPNIPLGILPCAETYDDGNPRSRHTYDGLEYIPSIDSFWSAGGSLYCETGINTKATWVFDFMSSQWKRKADIPAPSELEYVSAYDFVTGHTFLAGPSTPLYEYDPIANTWTKRSNDPVGYDYKVAAIDSVRRRFIAIGGGQVLSYDLSAQGNIIQQKLNTTGATEILDTTYNLGLAYPGFTYDSKTGKLVAWRGGADVYSLDIETLVWTKHTALGSVIPTPQPRQGTFGRWQYIPSKNVFIGVNSIDENVFIYKLTSGTGQINIPLKTWVAEPLPGYGKGPWTSSKHLRLAHNPVNGRIYFAGGDYTGPIGSESGRNEVYSYSVAGDDWKQEFPYCGPDGSVQPDHPDEVGWVYDTKRNIFWMLPGSMDGIGDCPNSTYVKWKMMTFDPVTGTWNLPNRNTGITGEAIGFAVYDPVSDTIIRFYQNETHIYDIASDTWSKVSHTLYGKAVLGREYPAVDWEKRQIYVMSPFESRLYRYDMDTKTLTYVTDTPVPIKGSWGGQNLNMIAWDSINKVLFWPQIFDFSGRGMRFHVYHPDTNTWEPDMPIVQPEGLEVRGNSLVFDPYQNVLLLTGASGDPPFNPYLFLYRYGNGTLDITPPTTPQNLQVVVKSETQLDLSWQASTDAESGIANYKIYRNGSVVGQSTTTYFSNTSLAESTTYTYEISAVNGSGIESAKSAPVSATTLADTTPPAITSLSAAGNATKVTILFSEPIDQTSATTTSNYAIDNGITIQSASLDADQKTVTLLTSSLLEGITYTITVNNIKDKAKTPNTILPNTQKAFTFASSLIGYWKFDEESGTTTIDSSGNNNHGTLANNPSRIIGKVSRALEFDNTDDYVEVPNTGSIFNLTNAWTLSAWVKPNAAGTDSRNDPIIWKIAQNGGNDDTFALAWDTNNTFAAKLERASDGVDFNTNSLSHNLSQWYYVVGTYDGNDLKIYINATLEGSNTIGSVTAYTGTAPLRIGNTVHSDHGNKGVFNGAIDEVRIYNRALSQAEIQADMDNHIGGTKGDVQCDKAVDVLDVQALVNCILGTGNCDWGCGNSANVNGDDSIDILDVQEVVNIILGG